MTIQFEKLRARLLANPKVKAEYDALAPEFEIAAELLKARLRAGLSQAELAAGRRSRDKPKLVQIPACRCRSCGILANTYAASTALLTACGSAIERKNDFG
jgi:hypothetical protein